MNLSMLRVRLWLKLCALGLIALGLFSSLLFLNYLSARAAPPAQGPITIAVIDHACNIPGLLEEQPWNAAIFAGAGLERLERLPENHVDLQWMIPAPAQGAIMEVAREEDNDLIKQLKQLNDQLTKVCTEVERGFLRELEGGCSAPIGALAQISGSTIQLKGLLSSLDGQHLISLEEETDIATSLDFGAQCARKLLKAGGSDIMKSIKMNSE